MIINSLSVHKNGRNYINGQPLAHFVWNHYNPDNPWKPGYVVHHKDKDTLNDNISNLELLTKVGHVKLHHIGRITSEDTKKKLSDINKGKKLSVETCKKLSERMKGNKRSLGFKHTVETCKKISERMKGKQYCLGKKASDETKKKMSSSQKGRTHSDESKKKMSEAAKGKPSFRKGTKCSEETIKRMSEAKKGDKNPMSKKKRKVCMKGPIND